MCIGCIVVFEIINLNYVEIVCVKGVFGCLFVWKYIFWNVFILFVFIIMGEVFLFFGGFVFVEMVFVINGFGWLFFNVVINGDLLFIGMLMFIFIFILVGMNIL